jgi:uncharacterized protein (UPF0371 family)
MPRHIGFDNALYLAEQTQPILDRVKKFDNKLYLEFGGKLLFDYHAARVLPGYDPNVKMMLLQQLRDKSEIVLCIYAGDIERKKIRGDFGITYDADALKLIDDLREWKITVSSIVITRFDNQQSVAAFKKKVERSGIRVYTHRATEGYPTNVDMIVSEKGYGANEYIETSKPIVVVTGPGPGSGKLATCLSQLYHEHQRGIHAGYAKFETFPIWDLPLKHPVNIAYEAATADIGDFNMIDSFHLEAYNERSVNYNRDVEAFPLLKRIVEKITGTKSFYQSPTDMGVNRARSGIIDNDAVRAAAHQEIIRRYFRYECEYAVGFTHKETVERVALLLDELHLTPEDRPVVKHARAAAKECERKGKGNDGVFCGAAIELKNGDIVTGLNSPLMHASSALILNAVKHLGSIPDERHLLPPTIIGSISHLKKEVFNRKMMSLDLEETLISLSIGASNDPSLAIVIDMLKELRGCEVHMTHIPTPGDEAGFRKLGVNLTSDPDFSTKRLFVY